MEGAFAPDPHVRPAHGGDAGHFLGGLHVRSRSARVDRWSATDAGQARRFVRVARRVEDGLTLADHDDTAVARDEGASVVPADHVGRTLLAGGVEESLMAGVPKNGLRGRVGFGPPHFAVSAEHDPNAAPNVHVGEHPFNHVGHLDGEPLPTIEARDGPDAVADDEHLDLFFVCRPGRRRSRSARARLRA